jgi:hypothetical protein
LGGTRPQGKDAKQERPKRITKGIVILGSLIEIGVILVDKLTSREDESFSEDRLLEVMLGIDLSPLAVMSLSNNVSPNGIIIVHKFQTRVALLTLPLNSTIF